MYVFKYFGDMNGLILFNAILYIFSFLGFFLIGLFLSNIRLNIKYAYLVAYILFIIAFLLLFIFWKVGWVIYVFSILYGFWNGSFWCANHSYELSQITKEKRDFYSSSVTLLKNVFTILIPFLISFVFLLQTKNANIDGYKIIFIVLPILYLSSFLFIKNLPAYFPQNVSVKNILSNLHPKEIYQNLFFVFSVQTTLVPKVILIIVTIYVLKTEVNIGIFQSLIWVISILITALLSTKRNEENRLKIMTFFAIFIFLNYIFLGWYITLLSLTVFTILDFILKPGFDISTTVYTMKYMGDLKKDHTMFLSKVIFRELVLVVGRLLFFIPFFMVINFYDFSLEQTMKYSLLYCGCIYILSVWFVFLEEKRLKIIA